MNTTLKELLFTSIPVLLLWAGGILALFKTASAAFKSMVLHFAAGVVFSVVAVEILPDMVRLHSPVTLVGGFITGLLLMLLVKWWTKPPQEEPNTSKIAGLFPWTALSAFAIDLLIDGILLGVGFAAGEKEGILLAAALALECFSIGIAVITTIRTIVPAKAVLYGVLAGLALVFIAGAAAGLMLLHKASDTAMEFILSFGAAALLYLVTEELLVEAHEEKDTPISTSWFFGGFLIFLVLGIIL
ncbi:transporter [Mucilaginibacter hurinus]|uniref:Transporter n=1 Tax=Mucilaginibacter hurinus TaxID=2201324 RepID=A0A367GTW0_9SPHI|nr:transporter [Mucilaginibacter hurinus]RCH56857.1 transporter [Mucilaginibacter hurinus]